MKAIYAGDEGKSNGFTKMAYGHYLKGGVYEVLKDDRSSDGSIKVRDKDGETWWEDAGFFLIVPDGAKLAPMSMPKANYAPWVRGCDVHPITTETRRAIKTQKQIAKLVMEQLSIIDPNCIVAGGAPRNWEQNKVANDIDVYLYAGETHSCSSMLRALKKLFGESMVPMGLTAMELNDVSATERLECPYDAMDIKWVFEGNVMGTPVQFIVMKQPTFSSVVDRFDTSICKIWFDGNRIIETGDYKLTRSTGVIFVKDPEGRQNKHLEKMYRFYNGAGYVFTTDDVPRHPANKTYTRNSVKKVWTPTVDSTEFAW